MEICLWGRTKKRESPQNRYQVSFIQVESPAPGSVPRSLLCPHQLPIRHPLGLFQTSSGLLNPSLFPAGDFSSSFTEKTKPACPEPQGLLLPPKQCLPSYPSSLREAHQHTVLWVHTVLPPLGPSCPVTSSFNLFNFCPSSCFCIFTQKPPRSSWTPKGFPWAPLTSHLCEQEATSTSSIATPSKCVLGGTCVRITWRGCLFRNADLGGFLGGISGFWILASPQWCHWTGTKDHLASTPPKPSCEFSIAIFLWGSPVPPNPTFSPSLTHSDSMSLESGATIP